MTSNFFHISNIHRSHSEEENIKFSEILKENIGLPIVYSLNPHDARS